MVERTAPGAMPRRNERRAIDDPGAGMLAWIEVAEEMRLQVEQRAVEAPPGYCP